jgi:hypothetical protein
VLFGSGDGSLGAPINTSVFGFSVVALAAGQFNADTNADIVVTGEDPASLWSAKVFMGIGDGHFNSPAPTYVCDESTGGDPCPSLGRVSEVAVAPLSRGPHPDVIVSLNNSSASGPKARIGVLKATVSGFQPLAAIDSTLSNPSAGTALAIADFDGDTLLDVAQLDVRSTPKAHLLTGGGDGSLSILGDRVAGSDNSVAALAAGNFTADANVDLVSVGSNFIVYPGNGDGTFKAGKSTAVGGSGLSVATADFNGDGILDAVVANWSGGSVTLLIGLGDGTFVPTIFGAGQKPTGLAVGDLNGDHKPDIVVADSANVLVLLNSTP